jgi:hypothetical protein
VAKLTTKAVCRFTSCRIPTLLLSACLSTIACGGGGSSSTPPTPPAQSTITSVTVAPTSSNAIVNATQQFTASVQGTRNFSSAINWSVNDVPGGNSTVGTVTATGVYVAPSTVPSPATVTVKAASVQDSTKSGSAAVTVDSENVQISISPSTSSVQLGATQQFNVTITGTVNQNYNFEINGQPSNAVTPWGTIGVVGPGTYKAPSLLPASPNVTITAVSLEDPSKTASATITILASAGGINVSVSPPNSTIPFDGSKSTQFNASVTGTANSAVTWRVTDDYGNNLGQITANGLFTPSAQTCNSAIPRGVVRAISVANSGAQGTATINLVPPTPVITGLSPQPAPVEATLQISGTMPASGVSTVLYPGPNGSVVPGGMTVPLGSSSGPLSVQVACGPYPPVTSNPVAFSRESRLRIRADKKDLASGESVQLHASFLGDPTPQTVAWGSGISAEGVYTAPSQVANNTFVKLTGCLQNTPECDSLIVRVNPFTIAPEAPIVPMGATLDLSALMGSATVSPIWSLLAGGGNLASDGAYTAPTTLQDGGPVLVSASFGGSTSVASVGVTGGTPGLVNRVNDYLDTSTQTPPTGTLTSSLAVDGTHAYVLSVDTLPIWAVPKECWIDAYDISDPQHPEWIDAAEALNSEPSTYKCYGSLSAYGGFLYEFLANAGSGEIAVYSLSGSHLQLQQVFQVPGVSTSPLTPPAFNAGKFYALSNANQSSLGDSISAFVFDLTGGSLVRSNLTLPLPQTGISAEVSEPVGSGSLVYFLIRQPADQTGSYKIAVYDISVSPAALVGTVDASVGFQGVSQPGILEIFGNSLYDGWDVYDISGALPVRTGTIPFAVQDVNPKSGHGLVGILPVSVLDVSSPDSAKIIGTVDDSGMSYFAGKPVWVGDLFYQTEGTGGFGIFDAHPPGGQIPLGALPNNGGSVGYGQTIVGSYLYTGEAATTGCVGGSCLFVNAYNLGTSRPTLAGSYSDVGTPLCIASLGNVLYVGTQQNLLVLDVSVPSGPVKVSSLAIAASALAVSGNTLFAGTTDNRLIVFDVSNAKNPVQVGQVALPDFPVNLRVAGSLVMIADNNAGLLTYAITNPSIPLLVSQYQASSAIEDLQIDGNLALLAAADGGLLILDMTSPSAPVVISQTNIGALSCTYLCDPSYVPAALSIGVNGGIVYVGTVNTMYGLVYGFDYRVPAHPRLVSAMGYGGALTDAILNFGFSQSQMYVGGSFPGGTYQQIDISQPRNTINLFYPGFSNGSGAPNTRIANKTVLRTNRTDCKSTVVVKHPKISAAGVHLR